eukprot:TRINITY_DN93918_c0_g1_i1.p1 TRINITY_DN93918_c0_g1~~TRINITY_DN93918_c0_g1_i1.p1  ORF type:complete len:271 (-),score=42.28 TRINITY_DN93918_c0_g1_i1:64-876(-)
MGRGRRRLPGSLALLLAASVSPYAPGGEALAGVERPYTSHWHHRRPSFRSLRMYASRSAAVDQAIEDDPWSLLGLSRNAGKQEVKARFKQLAATEHPDKKPGDEAAALRFKQITVAYQELMDTDPWDESKERARYAAHYAREEQKAYAAYADELEKVGLSADDLPRFKGAVVTFSKSVISVVVFALSCVSAYYIATGQPMKLVSFFFPDSPMPNLPEAELVRLGFKDTDEIRKFYIERSGRVPTFDDFSQTDREELTEKEERMLDEMLYS